MQPDPDAQLGQPLAQRLHPGGVGFAAPFALGVAQVHAVGAGVLGNHQQFLYAAARQSLGFAQHLIDRTRDQIAAHRRNDAEAAPIVAAFRNLQIGVVLGGELDAGVGQQVQIGIVLRRKHPVHGGHHAGVVLWPADRQHARMRLANQFLALAQAAGDDHLAVLGQRLADGVQRFGHRRVDEAAGVDHHHIGIVVAGHDVVALHLELGEDALGIDQRLGAAEADETDFWRSVGHGEPGLHRTRKYSADPPLARRARSAFVGAKMGKMNASIGHARIPE